MNIKSSDFYELLQQLREATRKNRVTLHKEVCANADQPEKWLREHEADRLLKRRDELDLIDRFIHTADALVDRLGNKTITSFLDGTEIGRGNSTVSITRHLEHFPALEKMWSDMNNKKVAS